MKRNVILIGGAPTVGKSAIAALISKRLCIPWISTDQIREIMKTATRKKDMPNLFIQEGYTAEKFFAEFSVEEMVRMEMKEGESAWIGIKNVIEDDYTWKDGFIIERINILPRLVAQDFSDNKSVRAVFLIDEDADRTRHVVFTRGLWDDAHTYSDEVKEKEVEWSLLFGNKIKAEARKYGYPCVEVTKNHNDVEAVLNALNLP